MIDGRKVVVFTPAGRRAYLEMLAPYLVRDHAEGTLDEWILYINTTVPEDIAYIHDLRDTLPFVRLIAMEHPAEQMHERIRYVYRHLTDPDTVYVRMDDDICYVRRHALANLVSFRIENPGPLMVMPSVVNNTRMAYLHQHWGHIPYAFGAVPDSISTGFHYDDAAFAEKVHARLILGDADFTIENHTFPLGTHVSVNCFAMFGYDIAEFAEVGADEERWLTEIRTAQTGRAVQVAGGAIVSHFAYRTQRAALEQTPVFAAYRALASLSTL